MGCVCQSMGFVWRQFLVVMLALVVVTKRCRLVMVKLMVMVFTLHLLLALLSPLLFYQIMPHLHLHIITITIAFKTFPVPSVLRTTPKGRNYAFYPVDMPFTKIAFCPG